MSGTFSGFSEDDIKKVQNGLPVQKPIIDGKQAKFAPKNKKPIKSIVKFDESKNQINNISDTNDIPEEAKLCKTELNEKMTLIAEERIEVAAKQIETKEEKVNDTVSKAKSEDNVSVYDKKPVDLNELQARQKLMEEQNRRRKEVLIKALADKKKRTQEEAHKLNEIQNEFKKLDLSLSNDVKFLRKRIEFASIEYMEAEKRYVKMEKEYLDAKLALQQKLEKKELLTEHLCTIIEQNEERKAKKLTELLNKLDLEDINENESNNP